jgi:dihydroflavonol-4-reductase
MEAGEALRTRPVLVTGAGGFLGVNVVAALREHGLAVRALVRRPPTGPQWQGISGVEFVRGDVCDPPSLRRAVAGVEAVIHTAALTDLVPRPRREAFRVNVEGTRHVCEVALRVGVRRLVFTSSVCTVACGTAAVPATEDTPYNLGGIPAPYYASKRRAERVVREYHARGLEAVTLCPALILGPRDSRPNSNALLLWAARGPAAWVPPGGMNVIDVREAALAHVRALWVGRPGQRYLLAGPYCPFAELAREARRAAGVGGRVHVLPRWVQGVGSLALALGGVLPWLPRGLTLPSFRYGFVAFHVSGARADEAFGLVHRTVAQTVADTLHWFRSLTPPRPAPGSAARGAASLPGR